MREILLLTLLSGSVIGLLVGIGCGKWEVVVICGIVLLVTLASCKE